MKNIKKIGLCLLCSTALHAQTLGLDQAIQRAAQDVQQNLNKGVVVSVINMNTPSEGLSQYIIDELTGFIVRGKSLKVVERSKVDFILKEQQFQLSGYVSDASMTSIGMMLGAQSIITGTLTDTGAVYRLVLRCLNVKSAEIEVMYQASISKQDQQVAFWLKSAPPVQNTEAPSPAADFEYEIQGSGVSRTVAITKYKGTAARVVIPDRINGLPVTTIGEEAFSWCDSLTSVSIPTSETQIV